MDHISERLQSTEDLAFSEPRHARSAPPSLATWQLGRQSTVVAATRQTRYWQNAVHVSANPHTLHGGAQLHSHQNSTCVAERSPGNIQS